MAVGARVENIEALKVFKIQLLKFAEKASASLEDAESELQRTVNWLEVEQPNYWASQIKKRHELLERAKEALRMKSLFKDATGRRPSAIDEERAVAAAKRKLEEAMAKAHATKQWAGKFMKEFLLYKGQVTRLMTTCTSDIPAAAAQLNNMVITLEQYAAVPVETVSIAAGSVDGGMARGAAGEKFSRWSVLRKRTPTLLDMDAATPASLPQEPWASGTLNPEDQQILEKMSDGVFETLGRAICYPGIWNERRVYFERIPPLPDGSGVYIGTGEEGKEGASGCVCVKVEELLQLRPDLKGIFGLPLGSIAVVETQLGLRGVVDIENQDRLRKEAGHGTV